MEDLVIVESKDYSQVVFDDVTESYKEDVDLECRFTLNSLLKHDKTDYIGIYKVGFKHPKEFYSQHFIDLHEVNENNKGKIIITADKLPKENEEFYQFVYVSQNKQIRGASIPFQFRRSRMSDYIQIDEQDGVVIKSKENELNETLNEIKAKCLNLSEANELYEKLVKENEDLIKMLKEEVTTVKIKCLNLSTENEKLNSALKLRSESLKSVHHSIDDLANENSKLRDKYEQLANENRNLVELLQRRINQVDILKNELESMKNRKEELEAILNLKECELLELKKDMDELNKISNDLHAINEQINKLEKQVDERVNELSKIKIELKQNEGLVSDQALAIQTIINERDSLNSLIEKMAKEKDQIESARDLLSQELLMSKDKLLAADQCKELLRTQLTATTNDLEAANLTIKLDTEKIHKFIEREQLLEKENNRLIDEINKLKIEYSTNLEQCNGSYYALNVANSHLENRLKTIQQKNNKEVEDNKKEMDQLRRENENLKQRIRAGAFEYVCLNKKYLKLKSFFSNNFTTSHSVNHKENELDSLLQDKTISERQKALLSNCSDSALVENFYNSSLVSNSTQNDNMTRNLRIAESTPINTITDFDIFPNKVEINKSKNEVTLNSGCEESELLKKTSKPLVHIEDSNQYLSIFDGRNTHNQSIDANDQNLEIKNCDICGYIFPSDLDILSYEEHMSTHYGPSCPICFLTFRKGYPQIDFENHVNNHFAE